MAVILAVTQRPDSIDALAVAAGRWGKSHSIRDELGVILAQAGVHPLSEAIGRWHAAQAHAAVVAGRRSARAVSSRLSVPFPYRHEKSTEHFC